MRTTIDIDASVMEQLRARQEQEGTTLGKLVSRLLARALASEDEEDESAESFSWHSAPLGLKVDLEDSDALYRILDEKWYGERR